MHMINGSELLNSGTLQMEFIEKTPRQRRIHHVHKPNFAKQQRSWHIATTQSKRDSPPDIRADLKTEISLWPQTILITQEPWPRAVSY